jgi:transposase-like protein
MRCPYCQSIATTERPDRTALGYRRFRCHACTRGFNERTGTPFNRLQSYGKNIHTAMVRMVKEFGSREISTAGLD